jgi:UDP-N-acetylmuramoylalanine--D-glutamate ligase
MEMDPKSRIAVLGGGIEGKAAVRFLQSLGCADITLCDRNEKLKVEGGLEDVRLVLGRDYLKNLDRYGVIFRSPGVPRDLPELAEAEKEGARITSTTIELFDRCAAPIIGVTGTNGKTTTTSLITEILKSAFGARVHAGGNDRAPLLHLLPEIKPDHLVVLEMSSFQLADLEKSPHVSVVLNFTPNHLDHHKDMDDYYQAKAHIVRFQRGGDFAVLNHASAPVRGFSEMTPARSLFFNLDGKNEDCAFERDGECFVRWGGVESRICREADLPFKTCLDNILAASLTGLLLGVPLEKIAGTVLTFTGINQRLTCVRERNGVRFYNDSSSTTPESSALALLLFPEGKAILIAGGSDKGIPFDILGRQVVKSRARVVLYGAMKHRIREAIEKAGRESGRPAHVELSENLEEAVEKAASLAVPSDSIVFSPACASFDMFTNSKERGRIFDAIVAAL